MIKVTSAGTGVPIFLNSFWIESVYENFKSRKTEVYVHGDEDPYTVQEDVDEVIHRIEDDRR